MTDTTKPLVPLYPYQCQYCGGRKLVIHPKYSYQISWEEAEKIECFACQGSGISWLPTPHPAPIKPIHKAMDEVLKEYAKLTPEEFQKRMEDHEIGPVGITLMGMSETPPDEPYTKGGD